MEKLSFLTEEQVQRIQREFGTPVFVYDQKTLEARARDVLDFPNAYGLLARYAMKACPTRAIVQLMARMGLDIDASSGFEAERAMAAGVEAGRIQITAQELPRNLEELLEHGVLFTACSPHQLNTYGELRPDSEVCIRVNPGLGSGHSNRTNVGGPGSSFGIWHEHLDEAARIQEKWGLRITRMHTHIGSGSDPDVWNRCAQLSLKIAGELPEVRSLCLGGGFKVARMASETATDLQFIGGIIQRDFEVFAERHGRELRLEIEPGTYLIANAAALVCTVIDAVDTGAGGYSFLKVDAGMTEVTRPSLYGAQHPLVVVPTMPGTRAPRSYIVAGHCCESGDVLTPAEEDPEALSPREMLEAQIGDPLVVEAVGAYCSGMSTKNYNSFPEAAELLLDSEGDLRVIRRRQDLAQMVANEEPL